MMNAATSTQNRIGSIVAGCVIERWVATSNHATVFLAQRDGVRAALKLARNRIDPLACARLAREAEVLKRVDHPSLSRLLDAGTWLDGTPYVVTTWVEGTLFEERLRAGPIAWPEIVRMLAAVARGLCVLHAAGIVHRDLKPSNIILPASGQPAAVVLDLGHASLLGDPRITQSGAAVGSLPYMAPEQISGGTVDGRADLFAVGVILYRALTGQLPFTPGQVLSGDRELVAPAHVATDVPLEAEQLCRWLLAREPAERMPTTHVLAVTLSSLLKEQV
jgi:serine/threonine-protein kinase